MRTLPFLEVGFYDYFNFGLIVRILVICSSQERERESRGFKTPLFLVTLPRLHLISYKRPPTTALLRFMPLLPPSSRAENNDIRARKGL